MADLRNITVLLVDDHTVVRQALRSLLDAEEDMSVVGEAENGRQAVKVAKRLEPEVVVMDIAMPLLNGLDATAQIRRDCPKSKVLLLSSHSDDEYVRQMTEVGASGYLLKQTAAQDLVTAIREVEKGNAVLSPAISKRMLEHGRASKVKAPGERKLPKLTLSERQVVQLIAEGYSNKQIAKELSVSLKTVDKHRQRLMHKLDLHNVAGITRYAIAKRIIVATQDIDTGPPRD